MASFDFMLSMWICSGQLLFFAVSRLRVGVCRRNLSKRGLVNGSYNGSFSSFLGFIVFCDTQDIMIVTEYSHALLINLDKPMQLPLPVLFNLGYHLHG